jgi:hypothetical protein
MKMVIDTKMSVIIQHVQLQLYSFAEEIRLAKVIYLYQDRIRRVGSGFKKV